ncbi:MAG: GNAT family N-acetyltransferase [Myxococcota bacterium]|nr:GNAT family N-acetyltransferase [Myxococcota bacterium]
MHAVNQGTPPQSGVNVVLRDGRSSDAKALGGLWRELMDYHESIDDRFALAHNADQAFQSYLDNARKSDDYLVRVAEVDGECVGFTISCILPNSPAYRTRWVGYINDICVTDRFRGRGIGEALVKDAVKWLRTHGAESVEVYVSRANPGAQKFWRRVGGRDYLDRLTVDISGED